MDKKLTTDRPLTMGSLFAGIGGFDLAALEAGIQPVFCSEIEPYPRLVLAARFPDVRQYGDIRKLNGAELPPVQVVTFGSPCQSFSQAGGRLGLSGESGLFHEAVRVIKEMRRATGNRSPRYAVMENVPGIYSSKSGGRSDFREVLNELLKIKDEAVDVPLPKDGRFLTAGAIVGNGYSLAWRTLCSSQFGTAQRRRRMFLVVDLDGECAAEILSEPEGKGRDFTPGFLKGQGPAGGAEAGIGGVAYFEPGALQRIDKSVWQDHARTIRAHMGDNQAAVAYACPLDLRNATRPDGGSQGTGVGRDGGSAFTVTAACRHGVALEQHVISSHANDARYKECQNVAPTIKTRAGTGGGNVDLCVEVKPMILDERKPCAAVTEDIVGAVTATQYKGAPVYFEPHAYNICADASNSMRSENPTSGIYKAETSRTIDTGGGSPSRNQGGTVIAIQGSAIGRREGNGPGGIGFREDAAYTVNTVDNGGAVAYQETVGALCASDYKGLRSQDISGDKAVAEAYGSNELSDRSNSGTALKASSGDHPGGENMAAEKRYAVRRLTPLECLRLQAFPDFWLDGIHVSMPSSEDIACWRSAWAELGKTKTDSQIRKWLSNPYSDSNAYKAIGNSLAVPCALWVLRGIAGHGPM